MIITDALCGRTVEDVRRHPDGSVTFYCDSGHRICLYVSEGRIEAKPPDIKILEASTAEASTSARMNLLQAFQDHMVNYVIRQDNGFIKFVCEPHKHNTKKFAKSHGHRTILLTHKNGRINELPPVSAVIGLPGLAISSIAG